METGSMTPEQRLEAFQKLVLAGPDDPFTRYALAMHLRSMGRLEEAVEALAALGARVPDYLPTWLMLGQALEAAGRDGEAARAYQDGVAAASRKPDLHARGELEAALEALRSRSPEHAGRGAP
jgi:predicted Zn-dependent protease